MLKKICAIALLAIPSQSFGQFYFGPNMGWSVFDTKVSYSNFKYQTMSSRMSNSGLDVGAHAGYDKNVLDKMFLGVEMDAGYNGTKSTYKALAYMGNPNNAGITNLSVRVKTHGYLGLHGKAGLRFDKTKIYAQVGYVGARVNVRTSEDTPALAGIPAVNKKNLNRNGLSLGIGVSTQVAEKMRVGLLLSHTFYKSKTRTFTLISPRTYGLEHGEHTAMVQLSYTI